MRIKSGIAAILAIYLLFSSSSTHAQNQEITLVFGLYQSDKATEMHQKFTPVIEALESHMSDDLGRPVDIQLQIHKTYKDAQDALVDGTVDFVRFGPVSYILSRERNHGITLLAMENKKGGRTFKGVIIVQSDSPIQSLEDLKGLSFAFGDSNSTIGRYLAQSELMKAGVYGRDLHYEYLGRHDKVAKAVALGDFQAGALKESSYRKANESGELRVLHSFDNVTKPWAARAELPQDILDALISALMEIEDRAALKSLKVHGFFPGDDTMYHPIREAISEVRDFQP